MNLWLSNNLLTKNSFGSATDFVSNNGIAHGAGGYDREAACFGRQKMDGCNFIAAALAESYHLADFIARR